MTRFYLRIARMTSLAAVITSLAACALSGNAIQGRVLEAETNKAIPDAIVVARWIGRVSSGADSSTVCYHVETATTDAEGIYQIPAWRKEKTEGWHENLTPERVGVSVYKEGYEWLWRLPREEGVEYLKLFTGSQERLLRIMAGAAVTCAPDPSRDPSEKALLPLYHQVYEDVRPLAANIEEKAIVNNLLFYIERLELSFEEADRRRSKRLHDIKRSRE